MPESRLMTVGIGELRVSRDPAEAIVTYALGSCVAVTIHDSVASIGGLLHFMLPDSSLDPGKASRQPCLFADTGIPLLFRRAREMGAGTNRVQVKLFGGAQLMDERRIFDIGERNCIAAKGILSDAGISIHGEDLGGSVSRSVWLEVGSGRVSVKTTFAPEGGL